MSSRFVANGFLYLPGPDGVSIPQPPGQPLVFLDGTEAAWTASMNTAPFEVKTSDAFSVQFSTGAGSTLVGNFALQVTNDVSEGEQNGAPQNWKMVNWSTKFVYSNASPGTPVSAINVASGAQSLLLFEPVCTYRWARIVFAFVSGSGSPIIRIQHKGAA